MEREVTVTAFTSLFAGDPAATMEEGSIAKEPLRFSGASPLPVVRPTMDNRKGCSPYEEGSVEPNAVLFVDRGGCTFLRKLLLGKDAGAAGVVVAADTNDRINPTVASDEPDTARAQLSDVALVVLGQTDAQSVSDLLDFACGPGTQVRMLVEHRRTPPSPNPQTNDGIQDNKDRSGQILYVNGRALINVELLV